MDGVFRLGEGSFTGAGGLRIAYRSWSRPTPRAPRAIVILVHPIYDHSGRYDEFGRSLARCGMAVWVCDQRGHGNSDGTPGVIDSFDAAAEDLGQMLAIARETAPAAPAFVVGHSIGAITALRFALDHQHELAGLICSAPALDRHDVPRPIQVLLDVIFRHRLAARLSSRVKLFSLDPEQISSDPEEVRSHAEDPLIHHGRVALRTANEVSRTLRGPLTERIGELTLPMLILHGEDDKIVAPQTSQDLFDAVHSADKTLAIIPGMRHALYHEQRVLRRRFNDQIADWIEERILPGEAEDEGEPEASPG